MEGDFRISKAYTDYEKAYDPEVFNVVVNKIVQIFYLVFAI
jgi:hypothetical protein